MAKNKTKKPADSEQPVATENPAQEAVEAEVVEQAPDKDEKDTLIEQLTKQLEDSKDLLLRTAAEFDNFKRREAANRQKQTEFVKCETLKGLLPSLDNINRALEADADSADYAKGVAMTVKGLQDALTKMGLIEINPLNQPFDVNEHQAVMRVEDDSVGENTVVQVLQSGYKLGDTVLRHAMVKVANCD